LISSPSGKQPSRTDVLLQISVLDDASLIRRVGDSGVVRDTAEEHRMCSTQHLNPTTSIIWS
jgi:hypothetical protein